MKKLSERFRQYVGIFRGIRIPWVMLILVLLVSIAESQLFLQQATLNADIIDGTQQTVSQAKLIRFVVVTLGTAVATILVTYLGGWTYQKINLSVRNKLWNKLMRLPTRYYDGESGDALVSRVTTDASQSYVYFHVAISLVTAIYAAVASYVQMYKFSPVLSRYFLLLIPAFLLLAWLFGKLNFIAGQKGQTTMSKALGYLVEMTRNLRLVKAGRMEYREQQRGKKLFHQQFRAGIWAVFGSSSSILLIELLSCVATAITFLLGRNLVNGGTVSVGKLLGFYTVSNMLIVRFTQLMLFYGMLKQGNGQMEKIAEILDAPEEKQDGVEFDVGDHDIVAEHVDFSYGDRPILKDVSFTANAGEILGIAGIAGSGQRELLEAIAGLQTVEPESRITYIEPKTGEERIINGLDPLKIIRSGILLSFVPEDRFGMGLVGSMSIADNVMLRSYRRGKHNPFLDRK